MEGQKNMCKKTSETSTGQSLIGAGGRGGGGGWVGV